MKNYMPLNGLRWSRDSGSANCDMLQSDVLGRPGGVTSAFDIGTYKMSRITLRRVIRHDDYLVQGGNKKLRCTRLWNTPKMKNENVYLKEEK